jgi:acetyl esterase
MACSRDIEVPVPGQPALRLRVHQPTLGTTLPALVYLHGGGWVYFSLDTHDRLMREYAARAGRVVIGVDYARAPEARFPVALEQTVAAVRWLREHAAELGVDAANLAAAGDSVGANLALAAAMVLRDAGEGDALQGLLLNYGVYSDDDGGESFARFDGPGYTLTRDEMRGFWQGYLRSAADRDDPRAQPLHDRLDGLPPCLLVVADCDVLRDSSLQLAERLAAARITVTLQRYAGATHSFLEAMSFAALSQRALDDSAAWLRALGGASP